MNIIEELVGKTAYLILPLKRVFFAKYDRHHLICTFTSFSMDRPNLVIFLIEEEQNN